MARAQAAQHQFDDYVRSVTAAPADQIAKARALYDDGTIAAEEYETLKHKALAA